MPRYRLLTTAQIDGAVREPGYVFTLPDGVKPPHRAHVSDSGGAHLVAGASTPRMHDVPLAVEIDEEHEQRLAELQARQAQELAELDRSTERAELEARHSQELRELAAEGARRDLERRQAAEKAVQEERHAAEARGLEQRKPETVIVVNDADPEAMRQRQETEAAALAEKHERELAVLDPEAGASKPVLEPARIPSVADADWPAREPATTAGVHREALAAEQGASPSGQSLGANTGLAAPPPRAGEGREGESGAPASEKRPT